MAPDPETERLLVAGPLAPSGLDVLSRQPIWERDVVAFEKPNDVVTISDVRQIRVAVIGIVAFGLVVCRSSLAVATEATFGVLALPLGLPALFDAYRRSTAT